jgi:hypothetical protein
VGAVAAIVVVVVVVAAVSASTDDPAPTASGPSPSASVCEKFPELRACGGEGYDTATTAPYTGPESNANEDPNQGSDQGTKERSPTLDEGAILNMLRNYLSLYNAGDYAVATKYLSSTLEAQCGGPTDLAFALAQNHDI